jgi:ATP-binding cassette subfamily F protein uup
VAARQRSTLEKDIAQLEIRKEKLIEQLNAGTGSHKELADWAAELKQTDKDLDSKGERWLELADLV